MGSGQPYYPIDPRGLRGPHSLSTRTSLIISKNHKNKVGYSERTDAVVEPKISTQWFLSMKEIKIPALDNVMNDNIKFTWSSQHQTLMNVING